MIIISIRKRCVSTPNSVFFSIYFFPSFYLSHSSPLLYLIFSALQSLCGPCGNSRWLSNFCFPLLFDAYNCSITNTNFQHPNVDTNRTEIPVYVWSVQEKKWTKWKKCWHVWTLMLLRMSEYFFSSCRALREKMKTTAFIWRSTLRTRSRSTLRTRFCYCFPFVCHLHNSPAICDIYDVVMWKTRNV